MSEKEVVEALLPQAVKELRELAFAHPWKPIAPPDARHYRDLAPGIAVGFTLDMLEGLIAQHLSVAYTGREPDPETLARITRAFFGEALPAPELGKGTLGPMRQEGQMVSCAHRYAGATIFHFLKLARRAG